jgi:hypothetical protein
MTQPPTHVPVSGAWRRAAGGWWAGRGRVGLPAAGAYP